MPGYYLNVLILTDSQCIKWFCVNKTSITELKNSIVARSITQSTTPRYCSWRSQIYNSPLHLTLFLRQRGFLFTPASLPTCTAQVMSHTFLSSRDVFQVRIHYWPCLQQQVTWPVLQMSLQQRWSIGKRLCGPQEVLSLHYCEWPLWQISSKAEGWRHTLLSYYILGNSLKRILEDCVCNVIHTVHSYSIHSNSFKRTFGPQSTL